MDFNYFEKQREFNNERRLTKQIFDDEVRALRQELNAKIIKLQSVRDRKLDEIARREDKFVQDYREWKKNNLNPETPKP